MLKRRITILAITSVALCVFITLVVMTIHGGIVNDFKEKNHNFAGDCVVSTDSLVGFPYYEEFLAELRSQPFVFAAAAAVRSYGLLNQPDSDVNMGKEIMPTPISSMFNPGQIVVAIPNRIIDYCPKIDLTISCFPLTAKGALAKAATGLVNSKTFVFADDSHTHIPKIDSQMVYIPFGIAQKLCGMDGVDKRTNSIHVKFTENISLSDGCKKTADLWQKFTAKNADKKHAGLLQNVSVQSWDYFRRSSIAPMQKEQTMLVMLFVMLGLITVFIIFVVFYMIISHKSKDIGIFRSIGISKLNIIKLFLIFAMLIGVTGSVIGAGCGWAFISKAHQIETWLFEHYGWQLWDRSVYAIGEIPSEVEANVAILIVVSAIIASLLGAIIPSIQAVRKTPAEILQVNQL